MAQPDSSSRLPWFLPLLVALLVAGVGGWADGVVRRSLEKKLSAELETVLNANVTALDIWMRTQKRLALGIAEDPEVRTAALALLTSNTPAGARFGPNSGPGPGPGSSPNLGSGPGGLVGPGGPPGPEPEGGPGPGRGPGGFEPGARPGPGFPRNSPFDRSVQPRMKTAGFFVSQLVTTNLMIATGFGRGRGWGGTPVPEEHQAKFAELFATGEPVIITPFKPRPGRGPGFGRGDGPRPGQRGGPRGEGPQPPPGPPGQTNQAGPPSPPNAPGPFRAGGPPSGGVMQVAAPIRDTNGVVRGAVAFLLNPETEFSRILSVARSGASGETYAFDPEGLLLSQSRFDPQLKELGLLGPQTNSHSALSLVLRDPGGDLTRGHPVPDTNTVRPLIRLVADAVQGGAGLAVRSSRDYRGIPVVGAWQWLTNHSFGVATQIDADEAFQPQRAVRAAFLALFGLLAVAAAVALVITHFNFVWRRKATEAELKLRTLGQYTLEEKIGEGGMGVVFRARHALLRRDTAVKLLLPDRANETTIRQFEQEVRLTCGLTHPNTIQIYDFGRTPDGIFYYAMEFLRGLNLADLVHRHGPPPEERILHILVQVCDSLHEAHLAGLVHRDIKPANIFLCERGGVPDTVKVLDFGLVKCLADDELPASTATGKRPLSGTPNYLPPETIRDPDRSDPRSDIYALGAVACFLATGEPLFPADSVDDILDRQLSEAPVSPRARGAALSPELDALIMACLAKDPSARPAGAADLRQRLLACPAAGQWTFERRVAWWSQWENAPLPSTAAPTEPATPRPAPAVVEATLRLGAFMPDRPSEEVG